MSMARKITVCFAALSMGVVSLAAPAHATVISTEQMMAAAPATTSAHAAQLAALFDRQEVIAALEARGVDVAAARARVAALSDAEARELQAQIDEAPAGAAKVLVIAGVVFVVLLITDYLGLTRIFPFIRPIR